MKLKQAAITEFKAEEDGSFRAVFSTFNVKDRDGDVTLPGAFKSGQEVRIAHWGHRWAELPVGKGIISFDDTKTWVDGQFFKDTIGGMETYKTVKNLGSLQEWSYGFDILDQESGTKDGESVNFLKSLNVFEVSPVLLGAGINTSTEFIKEVKKKVGCQADGCKDDASLLIHLCDGHRLPADLKQALAECDEATIKALILELTPPEPKPKGPKLHELRAILSEARSNSHSVGGLK